jgi:predicted Zn-dependent peptidase
MRTNLLSALAVALVAAAAFSQPARADEIPKIALEKITLPNGLEVIFVVDHSVPLVAVSTWYHVGGGDEEKGRSGFAHLFEHMMFQGTKHTGQDVHFKTLEEIGATGINGTTSNDRTNYFQTVPAHQLETVLWLESDRMGYLLEAVTQKDLDNQRDVVKNERRQRRENTPYGLERDAMTQALYPEGHPYRYDVIGRHEDLTAASLEDVKAFFRKWYVPSNATIVIAGDFDPAEAKKLVEKWYGSFPKLPKPKQQVSLAPRFTQAKKATVEDPFARLRRWRLAWHSPKLFAAGDAELDILAYVLGSPGTGRIYKRLVLETQLATTVSVSQYSQAQSSVFSISADLKPDADLAKVQKVIDEELDRVRREPITEAEYKRARTNIESAYVWGLESLIGRAEQLQSFNHTLGHPDGFAEDLARYAKATPAGILKVAEKYLAPTARVEVLTMPKGGAK